MSRGYSRLILSLVVSVLLSLVFAGSAAASPAAASPAAASPAAAEPAVQSNIKWGQMPLCFIANNGQTDSAVSYYVKAAGTTVFFTPQGLTFSLADPATKDSDTAATANGAAAQPREARGRHVVKVDFLGAAADHPDRAVPERHRRLLLQRSARRVAHRPQDLFVHRLSRPLAGHRAYRSSARRII